MNRKKQHEFRSLARVLRESRLLASGDSQAIATGILEWDRRDGGLHPGRLIIVAGGPGVGKTGLALCVAEHAAVSLRRSVGIFSLESSAKELASRLLAAKSMVPFDRLLSNQMSQRQHRDLEGAAAALGAAPLYISEIPDLGGL